MSDRIVLPMQESGTTTTPGKTGVPGTRLTFPYHVAEVDTWWKAPKKDFKHGVVVKDIIVQVLPHANVTPFEVPDKKGTVPTCEAIHQLWKAVVKDGQHFDAVNISMGNLIRPNFNLWQKLKELGGNKEKLRIACLKDLEDLADKNPNARLQEWNGKTEPVGDMVTAVEELGEVAEHTDVFVAAGNVNEVEEDRLFEALAVKLGKPHNAFKKLFNLEKELSDNSKPLSMEEGNPYNILNVFSLAKGVHTVEALDEDGTRWKGDKNHAFGSACTPFGDHWGPSRTKIVKSDSRPYESENGTSYATPFVLGIHALGRCDHETRPVEVEQLWDWVLDGKKPAKNETAPKNKTARFIDYSPISAN